MGEMVKVQQEKIGAEVIQTVNARELHEFLGAQSRYNDWFRARVEKYGFVEGVDFIAITEGKVTAQGNRTEFVNHHVSLDMAKELSMVENNEKGRMARRYFIECEKKLSQSRPSKVLQDKSKEARKGIAAVWSERGASAPKHFINLTFAEYKALGYEKPRSVSKKDMNPDELARLMALEVFESIKLQRLPDVVGYHALKDSISATGAILEAALEKAVLEHEHKIGA